MTSGRLLAALLLAASVALLAGLVPAGRDGPAQPDPRRDPAAHAASARDHELRRRFGQAVAMLHAKQHEHAVTALHRVLELAPRLPEAHVNMGFALLGLQRADAARGFFESALALDPNQANAYYGLAMAHESLGDLALARGAMRAYLHLARHERDEHLARARAALWEWESPPRSPQATSPRPAPNPAATAGR